MTNTFIAKEFLNHCDAGLTLTGQNYDKELEWIGDRKEWNKLETLLNK